MNVDINRIFKDYDWSESAKCPESYGIFIPGNQGRIFSNINFPGGDPPYPTVIICHGMPGNEQLVDYSLILRQIGFCTVTFHYGGSWGSDGDYSLIGCMNDVESVLNYVLKGETWGFDRNNIFVLGHSMGGLLSARAIALYDFVKAGVIIMPADIGTLYEKTQYPFGSNASFPSVIREFSKWLHGYSWEICKKEVSQDIDKFRLSTYAENLAQKPVLTIGGSYDTDLPPAEHFEVLNKSIQKYDKGNLVTVSFPTNHGMGDQRYGIARTIASFLSNQLC